ncbi:MAG TPA: hypothetical protein VL475_01075 [Planctomycetaceae bacterium]|nr:hypothetical protein [Planctomycetaceae bacterium]
MKTTVSGDKELSDDLDREGTAARLVVEIDGKSCTGTLPHDRDHGHNH